MNKRPEPPSPDFAPVRVDLVEIGEPLSALPPGGLGGTERGYVRSLCLVRLHGRPLGLIEVDLGEHGVSAAELAARIGIELWPQVADHLRSDGLPQTELTAAGLPAFDVPPCIAAREELLADAPTVSVVIITRGRPERVRRTVRSIVAGRYPHDRYEVVVVDTPTAASPPLRFGDDPVLAGTVPIRIVEELRPGVSRGRNTGLDAATAEYVLFADDDVDVDPNWLATSMAAFRAGARVGATSGMTLPSELATPSQRWFEGFGGLQRGFETRVYSIDRPPADQPLFPFTVGELGSGRSMTFRRDLLRQLGGFDLALGPDTPTLAGEDIEAIWRVLLAGYQVVHEPAAIVWHDHPDHYAMLRRRMWGYGVGLTACLTKGLVERPELRPLLARKLPAGIRFAVSPTSAKNRKRQADYPRELIGLELMGLACGPFAYSRSRWQRRRRRVDGQAAAGAP